jgi:hypothetical protein
MLMVIVHCSEPNKIRNRGKDREAKNLPTKPDI